ncbi:AraC family transcriptional regulator, partial [Paenibacillus sp. 598K]|uniref:AraC family transcriptional regulator n=1 Tax=Paenibacillus sp. 598K TaxID=1117987 RepID=UPI001628055C
MKLRHRLIRYSVYRSMILNFLLLTAIIIAVVCGGLFALFSWSTAKEVGNISEAMLQQNSFVSKVIKDQVYNLGNQLLNSKEIMAVMVDRERDRIKEFHAVNELRSVQANYPFIQMIGIYNPQSAQYINTSGVSFEQEEAHLSRLESRRNAYFNFIPRTVSLPTAGNRSTNVLTFLLLPSYYTQLPTGGSVIVIDINESYVQRMIGGYKNYSSDSLFVMNEEGLVVTHSDPHLFMTNVANEPYASRILAAEAPTGNFTMQIDGRKNLVSYAKSQDMDWVFVNVSKYDNLLFNMNELRWSTLGIAVAMFVISLLISIWLTNHTYHPIRKLLDKFVGQMTVEKQRSVNEMALLDTKFAAMTGQLSAMESTHAAASRVELLHYFKGSQAGAESRLLQAWEGVPLLAVMIKIDSLDAFRRANASKMQSLKHFAVGNIAEELVGMYMECKLIIIEEGELGMLVRTGEEQCPPQLVAQLQELQSKVSSYFHMELSIGIGPVVHTLAQIRDSYRYAKECHQRRFFEGKGRIFEYERAREEAQETLERSYPIKTEKKLVEAIRSSSRSKAAAEVEAFLKEMSRCEYQQALFFLNQLALSLYKQFHTDSSSDGTDLISGLFQRLPAYETLQEIGEELKQIAGQLAERLEEAASQH